MCIAILQTKPNSITDEQFERCWRNNPDGAGLAYVHKGKILIEKELTSVDKFIAKIRACEKISDKLIIHFRWSTHGSKSVANIHPFRVSKDVVFVHNGILSDMPAHVSKSDTAMFCETLKRLPDGFIHMRGKRRKIDKATQGSKLIFLDRHNQHKIIHENAGHWKNGNWFSNHGYANLNVQYSYCRDYDIDYDYYKGGGYWSEKEKESCQCCGVVEKLNKDGMCEYCEKLFDAEAYKDITTAEEKAHERKMLQQEWLH